MKTILKLVPILIACSGAAAWAADANVKLSGVHLCCDGCVKGIDKAVGTVAGAKAESDKDGGIVSITAPDKPTAQKAVDAIVAAGYYGKSSDPEVKVSNKTGAQRGKVQSVKVKGVHLCCKKCVSGVNEALAKVEGVKGNTAAKDAESFEVTGDFEPRAVFSALRKAGFAGKVAN